MSILLLVENHNDFLLENDIVEYVSCKFMQYRCQQRDLHLKDQESDES